MERNSDVSSQRSQTSRPSVVLSYIAVPSITLSCFRCKLSTEIFNSVHKEPIHILWQGGKSCFQMQFSTHFNAKTQLKHPWKLIKAIACILQLQFTQSPEKSDFLKNPKKMYPSSSCLWRTSHAKSRTLWSVDLQRRFLLM